MEKKKERKKEENKAGRISLLVEDLSKNFLSFFFPKIFICSSMWICRDGISRERIVASGNIYSRARYDTIQVNAKGNQEWFAKVHLFFRILVSGKEYECSLLQWFDVNNGIDVTHLRRFQLKNHYQILLIDRIIGEVPIVEFHEGRRTLFHLDHHLVKYRQRC